MGKTFRKRLKKKFLIEEDKTITETPNFLLMSKEELTQYLKNYDSKKTKISEERSVFNDDDIEDYGEV